MNFKKNILLLITALMLTGLVSKVYLHQGFPFTHDGENHLARFANYKVALKEGQIPPRLAPNLMNHYGYPVFNYNYPLANILSLPFSFIKLNYQLTFKIIATTSLLFGLLGIWKWLHRLAITNPKVISLALVNYATAPLVISLFYHRGNIGEMLAIAISPWLFAELTLTIQQKKSSSLLQERLIILLTTGLWTAFFLSHNITVMFGTGILVLYFVAQKPNFITVKHKALPFLVGILASLWFWLPAIAEKSLIILDGASLSSGFTDHFVTLNQLVLSPTNFGFSVMGQIDTLSLGAGLASVFIVLVSILALAKSMITLKTNGINIQNKLLIILTVLSGLSLLFQLEITAPIWKALPFVSFIQFPWRLSLFVAISSSIVLGILLNSVKSKTIWFITTVLLFIQVVAVFNTKAVDYFSKNIIDYDLFSQSTSTANENLPKEFTYQSFSASWEPKPSVLEENTNTQISVESWTGSSRKYYINNNVEVTMIEPSMAFAGWETTVTSDEGNKIKATYLNNQEIGGRIAYQLQPGNYSIRTKFTQNTPARLLGNTTSAVAILGVLAWSLLPLLGTIRQKVRKHEK